MTSSSSSSYSSSSSSSSSSDEESVASKRPRSSRKRKHPEPATPERSSTQDAEQQQPPSPFKFGGEEIFRPKCYLEHKKKLDRFMEHKHKKAKHFYTVEHEYTLEELLEIVPKDLVRYFCNMLYGKDKPTADDLPTKGRASTATLHKSAISFFMPNSQTWDAGYNRGNPTKSKDVNKLLSNVVNLETQGRGKKSSADYPWEVPEYSYVVDKQTKFEDGSKRLLYPAMTTYQCSMIARIDDTAKLRTTNLRIHPECIDAYMSRMEWSKNVKEERDAPWQIGIAERDCKKDNVFHLANHLEKKYETRAGRQAEFIFCDSNENPKKVKGRYSRDLRENIVKTDDFKRISQSAVGAALQNTPRRKGSHSTRKYARTKARRKGRCSKDNANHRGRWKGDASRAPARYEDTLLPYPDALVAAELCHGGPIAYRIKSSSWVSNDWIVTNVSPNITAMHGQELGALFGRALLWACCDNDARVMIPDKLYRRVMSAFREGSASASQQQHGESTAPVSMENPITKKFLVVTERDDTAVIDVMDELNPNAPGGSATVSAGAGANLDQRLWRLEHVAVSNQEKINNIDSNIKTYDAKHMKEMASLKKVVMRGANQLHVTTRKRNHTATEDDGNIDGEEDGNRQQVLPPDATLSKTPRDLYDLWEEYDVGRDGRKAAKNFTAHEKGACKYTYCRRKVFWDLIKRVINHSGTDYKTAIEEIYQVYGFLTITKLHKKILADEKVGGHPNLYPDPERVGKRRKGRNS